MGPWGNWMETGRPWAHLELGQLGLAGCYARIPPSAAGLPCHAATQRCTLLCEVAPHFADGSSPNAQAIATPPTCPPDAVGPKIACRGRCSRQARTRAGPAESSRGIAQDKLTESVRCVAFALAVPRRRFHSLAGILMGGYTPRRRADL